MSIRSNSPYQYRSVPTISCSEISIEMKPLDKTDSFSLTDDEIDTPDRILINSKNRCPAVKRTKTYLIDQGDLENIIITTTENKRRIDKVKG